MARHSKWHNIKARKGAQDKARSKVFTVHSMLIALAAQWWADPDKNPRLFEAIEKAKKDNVPADNIERAVKKWSGADKDSGLIQVMYYEWYAPGGIAIIAKALTDNRNRTAPNMRHIFSKHGGALGETGSVSNFAFAEKGVIVLPENIVLDDALEELLLNSGAEDYSMDSGRLRIVCARNDLAAVAWFLRSNGFPPDEWNLEWIPNTHVEVEDFDKAVKIYKLLEDLEDDGDIEAVWHTAEMSEELLERIADFLDTHRFRT